MHIGVRSGLCLLALALELSVSAAKGPWDADVSDFPRLAGETGDSARIQRAVAAVGKGGVVWFPRGEYAIDEMLVITNQISLLLHKSAHLKAVKAMPFVLSYSGGMNEGFDPYSDHVFDRDSDHNLFIRGGNFDGNGLASAAKVMSFRHFTLADATFRNGRKVGLQLGDPDLPRSVEGGYEMIINNIYIVCKLPGLAGNIGFYTHIGDSHFTDMVIVDYTIGVRDIRYSNRYTRCHVWGGPVRKAGTTDEYEYLPNSICFDLCGADTVLDDCYADTAMIGFRIGGDARLFGCAYFNNWLYKMDNPTVIVHHGGTLLVSGGRFNKTSPHSTLYRREGTGKLIWRDNHVINFTSEEVKNIADLLRF